MFRCSAVVLLVVVTIGATATYELQRSEGRNARSIYMNTGKYVGKNSLATRTAIHRDEAILTIPRFKQDIPITLAKVSLKNRGCQGTLKPFPCWSFQEEGNCAALQSAVDVFLDPHEILWVLDTGVVNSLDQPIRRCPPKVVAFNVKTEKLVQSVDLSALVSPTSRLEYVIADYSYDGCVFIYVADAANRAILVYDVANGHGYRVLLPKAVAYGCARRDILYMALIHRRDGSSHLVFSYLNGKHVYSIRSDFLQCGYAQGRVEDLGRKPRNIVFLGTDNGSALYLRNEGDSDIYRLDLESSNLTPDSLQHVYHGSESELPTHVVPDYKRGRMRVLESNFPDYFQGTVGCGVTHALNLL